MLRKVERTVTQTVKIEEGKKLREKGTFDLYHVIIEYNISTKT
jgi:hypothetical protein